MKKHCRLPAYHICNTNPGNPVMQGTPDIIIAGDRKIQPAMDRKQYTIIETRLGWVGIMLSPLGVCATTLPQPTPADALLDLRIAPFDEEVSEEAFGALAGHVRACS